MNILLFYYDFNLDVELLVCALLTNSIHSNRLTEQPFVLFNLLFCCLIITVETHQKYHRGVFHLADCLITIDLNVFSGEALKVHSRII